MKSSQASAGMPSGKSAVSITAAIPPYVTSACVRSGCVAANTVHGIEASDQPRIAARSDPTASMTAWMSSPRCSSVAASPGGSRSESPVPSRSIRIRRLNDARRCRKRE
jgi:hypothetical protein